MKDKLISIHHSSFLIHHLSMSPSHDAYVPQVARNSTVAPEAAVRTVSPRTAYLIWACALVVVTLLVGAVILAPLAASAGQTFFSLALYKTFANLCHQMPERSFHFHGKPLAVCARCWGLYGGFALGFTIYPLLRSLTRGVMPHRYWLLLAAVPTSVDFLLGFTGIWANTHTSRALTGALLGAISAFYVVPGVVELAHYKRRGVFSASSSKHLN
jgi:uncharacterized membrane protein